MTNKTDINAQRVPENQFQWMDLPEDKSQRNPSELSIDPTEISLHIHYHTERERIERNKGLLRFDESLATIATAHSRDMRTREYIGHESPEGDTIGKRLDRFGYKPPTKTGDSMTRFGENIARDAYRIPVSSAGQHINQSVDDLANHVVQQWLDSPDHRKNLLNPEWVRQGIGTALYPYQAGAIVIVTQMFSNI